MRPGRCVRRVLDDLRRVFHIALQRLLHVAAGARDGRVRPGLHVTVFTLRLTNRSVLGTGTRPATRRLRENFQ